MNALAEANVILMRHGESDWNSRGLATGWADAGLTQRGRMQAAAAGDLLLTAGAVPDVLFASALRRAAQTAEHLLGSLPEATRPAVIERWQLNERHLGQLQGLDKETIKRRWGNAESRRWRSDPDALPPPLSRADRRHPRHDPRFARLEPALLPSAERIVDIASRVLACWRGEIVPRLLEGERVLVVAHRDSLRVLIAEIEGLGSLPEIRVPHALPRPYSVTNAVLAVSYR